MQHAGQKGYRQGRAARVSVGMAAQLGVRGTGDVGEESSDARQGKGSAAGRRRRGAAGGGHIRTVHAVQGPGDRSSEGWGSSLWAYWTAESIALV